MTPNKGWFKKGRLSPNKGIMKATTCKIDNCNRGGRITKGFCRLHYVRFNRHQDPMVTKQAYKQLTLEQIFLSNVEAVTESGCWVWSGKEHDKGYGRITYKGKSIFMHRYSYERFKGFIPENMNVCHTCDVTCCVNPAHLFLGTQGDNLRDMIKKGRNVGAAKLNVSQVREIKKLLQYQQCTEIAKVYNILPRAIRNIRNGSSWKNIGE